MSDEKTCNLCRFFTPTGTQNSGIRAAETDPADGKNWFYVIGSCSHDPVWGASCGRNGLASFSGCFMFKKGRQTVERVASTVSLIIAAVEAGDKDGANALFANLPIDWEKKVDPRPMVAAVEAAGGSVKVR